MKTIKERFLALEPYKFLSIGGWTFYEDPVYGDEEPVMATKAGDDNVYCTGFYDCGDPDELLESSRDYGAVDPGYIEHLEKNA